MKRRNRAQSDSHAFQNTIEMYLTTTNFTHKEVLKTTTAHKCHKPAALACRGSRFVDS